MLRAELPIPERMRLLAEVRSYLASQRELSARDRSRLRFAEVIAAQASREPYTSPESVDLTSLTPDILPSTTEQRETLAPPCELKGSRFLNEELSHALGSPLYTVLFFECPDAEQAARVRVDREDWQIATSGRLLVAAGPSANLVANSGFEYPTVDPNNIVGIISWLTGQQISHELLGRNGLSGYAICWLGEQRFITPIQQVQPGFILAGGQRRETAANGQLTSSTVPYPFLLDLYPVTDAKPPWVIMQPIEMARPDASSWEAVIGLMRVSNPSSISLMMEGASGSKICYDNLYVLALPSFSSQ